MRRGRIVSKRTSVALRSPLQGFPCSGHPISLNTSSLYIGSERFRTLRLLPQSIEPETSLAAFHVSRLLFPYCRHTHIQPSSRHKCPSVQRHETTTGDTKTNSDNSFVSTFLAAAPLAITLATEQFCATIQQTISSLRSLPLQPQHSNHLWPLHVLNLLSDLIWTLCSRLLSMPLLLYDVRLPCTCRV